MSDPSTAEIGACLQLLRAVLSSPPPDALAQMQHDVPGLSMRGAQHRLLLHTYRALQQLMLWVTVIADRADASALVTAIASHVADARVALHDQNLLGASYAAVLRGGVIEADAGGSGGQLAGAPNLELRSTAVLLDVDSAHADLGWAGMRA